MAEEDKSKETAENKDEAAQSDEKSAENKSAESKSTENKSGESKSDESTSDKSKSDAKAAKPTAKADDGKSKPAAKKEKPPKIEEKPFDEFMEQHYLPSLKEAMAKEGIDDLTVEFTKRKLEVSGQSDAEPYWQVQGNWEDPEGKRQFNIAFVDEDITGQKIFTLAANGAKPSTIEQFMGDERRITLPLLVMYTVQRLNAQKWLTRN